jgi:hypothetical protein
MATSGFERSRVPRTSEEASPTPRLQGWARMLRFGDEVAGTASRQRLGA